MEADRQNAYHLATIGAKERVAAGTRKLCGTVITNPILLTTDGTNLKTVDNYELHEIIKSITDGSERPKATTIRRLYIAIAGTNFDFSERTDVNVERFNAEATKSEKFGVEVHNDLKATVILDNIEWAAQKSWGSEIASSQREINAAHQYNHAQDASSIKHTLKIMDAADDMQDRCQAKSPEEMTEAVLQGIIRLQNLVNNPHNTEENWEWLYGTSKYESAYASESSVSPERGRRKNRNKKEKKEQHRNPYSYPSPSTLPKTRREKNNKKKKKASRKKEDSESEEEKLLNPTRGKHLKKTRATAGIFYLPKASHNPNATITQGTRVGIQSGYVKKLGSTTSPMMSVRAMEIDDMGAQTRRR